MSMNGSCCNRGETDQLETAPCEAHQEKGCEEPHHVGMESQETSEYHGHGRDCACAGARHAYPERGWIQFLILRILYEKPSYGYQLLEELEKRSGGYHKLMPGSIYTILRRMEHRGLLRSEWEKVESGPDRRLYRLTDEGVVVLRSGLEAVVRRRKLNEDLVKFYEEKFGANVEKGGGDK